MPWCCRPRCQRQPSQLIRLLRPLHPLPLKSAAPQLPLHAFKQTPDGVVIRVFHPFAKTDFEPGELTAKALRDGARNASSIEVRGMTDSPGTLTQNTLTLGGVTALATGSDEHAANVARVAAEQGLSPQEYASMLEASRAPSLSALAVSSPGSKSVLANG